MKHLLVTTVAIFFWSVGGNEAFVNKPSAVPLYESSAKKSWYHRQRQQPWSSVIVAKRWLIVCASEKDDSTIPNNVQDIDDLIISMSKITEDSERREKVSSVLQERLARLAKDEDAKDAFIMLFQDRLTVIGNAVRQQAAEAAASAAASDDESSNDNDPPVAEGREPASPELGKQLFALVDILIQSKILFKS